MGDELNRGELIGLLDRLGDEADQQVVEAARTIHQRVTSTGVTWDELLVPDYVEEPDEEPEEKPDEEPDEDPDEDEGEDEEDREAPDDRARLAEGESADALALVENLLARDIADTTREELLGYKEDIAEGEFDEDDLEYLRALAARLSKR